MKKTYIRPSFAVFAITTSSIMEVSSVKVDPDKEGNEFGTQKKGTTDMWGNENNKGIWD